MSYMRVSPRPVHTYIYMDTHERSLCVSYACLSQLRVGVGAVWYVRYYYTRGRFSGRWYVVEYVSICAHIHITYYGGKMCVCVGVGDEG